MKKLLAAVLMLAMLSTLCAVYAENETPAAPAPSGGGTVSAGDGEAAEAESFRGVTLRVEGAKENLFHQQIELTGEPTVLELVQEALKAAGMDCQATEGPYGGYITAIAGEEEGAFGGYDGWRYYVNGEDPSVSMSAQKVAAGDEILLVYGDMGILMPILTVSRPEGAEQAVLTVTADVTAYDENWNATVTREPVVGAAVTADGAEYITDGKGQVTLSKESSAKETISLQVEKYDEKGMPLVIRLAPNFQLALSVPAEAPAGPVSFSDVEAGKWYAPYVLEMAEKKAVDGYPDGKFYPLNTVTRAQAVSVLFKLAGGQKAEGELPFSDVAEGKWYAEAVRWALAAKVIDGPSRCAFFEPDQPITRQELALWLVRYQQEVVKTQLKQDGEAPAFADNDQISKEAAPAVYTLQKAGIVQGSNGNFNPKGTATRAELCKMLSGLLAAGAAEEARGE